MNIRTLAKRGWVSWEGDDGRKVTGRWEERTSSW